MSRPQHRADDPDRAGEQQPERVIIRDHRKINPSGGPARHSAGGTDPTPPAKPGAAASPGGRAASPGGRADGTAAEDSAAVLLEERTADLQRLQADYANYRRRAERDRLAAGDQAVGRALADLLPVLDDLDRARAHGDVSGALKSIGEKLDGALTKLGLEAFGLVGDPFDPAVHEAVIHEESDQVHLATCTSVLRQGYRYRDRLLRPAMVGVSEPASMAQPGDTVPGE